MVKRIKLWTTSKKVCFALPRALQMCSTHQSGPSMFGLVSQHDWALGAIDMEHKLIPTKR